MKKMITIKIDIELYHYAKDLGLNLSRFVNERLKELKIKTGRKL